MYLGEGKQPASSLVVVAMHRIDVFRHLTNDESEAPVIIDNDCFDPDTCIPRHEWMYKTHNKLHGDLKTQVPVLKPKKKITRIDGGGGAIKFSEYCPGYIPEYFIGKMDDFADAIGILNARTIGLSSHGDHCGVCEARGITVAQRIFLTVDAKRQVCRRLVPIFGELGIYCMYNRRFCKDGVEHQRTRVIDDKNALFRNIGMAEVMRMTDIQFVERLAPDLLERLLVS